MPVLDNQRHELFCQHVASGMSLVDSYEKAGFKKNRGAAARLHANVSISERIEELKESAASRAEIDRSSVLDLIQDIIDEAREAGQYGPAMTGAVKLGVDIGMFEQKSKVTIANPKNMTDEELAAFVASK